MLSHKKVGGGIAINWRNLLTWLNHKEIEQWTDEEWGSLRTTRAKSKGKKVPSKQKEDIC